MRRAAILLVASLAVAVVAAPALASTVLRFEVEDLVDRAVVIVHGKVVDKSARRSADGAIVTDLEVEVEEALKGFRGQTLTFTVYGGVLGTRGSAVAGAPQFEEDEEVLLFLGRMNQQGVRTTIGLSQGKYTIREVEGRRLAFRDLEGLRLMDRQSGKVEEAKSEQGVPFDALMERVRERLTASKHSDGTGR